MKNLIIIIAIFVFYSCKNELKETEYYPNNNVVKAEKLYNSIEDKRQGNYACFSYDSIGLKKSLQNYYNNQLNGKMIFYDTNGNIERITIFRNGEKSGVTRLFTEDGYLNKEILYINGKDVILKHFVMYSAPKSYGFRIYPLFYDTIKEYDYEGRIIYDTNMNVIDSVTFYYDVQKINDPSFEDAKLKVKLLGTAYNEYKTNINLILGELNIEGFSNNRYSLIDTIGIIKSDKNELEFSYGQFNYTDDLITGLLQMELYSLDGKEKIRDLYFTFYYDLNYD